MGLVIHFKDKTKVSMYVCMACMYVKSVCLEQIYFSTIKFKGVAVLPSQDVFWKRNELFIIFFAYTNI